MPTPKSSQEMKTLSKSVSDEKVEKSELAHKALHAMRLYFRPGVALVLVYSLPIVNFVNHNISRRFLCSLSVNNKLWLKSKCHWSMCTMLSHLQLIDSLFSPNTNDRLKILWSDINEWNSSTVVVSPQTLRGVVFSLRVVCLSVCEQNTSRTDALILMGFSF